VFPLLECLEYLETEKNYTYLYSCGVYNQLQKNHRCQCKQMHGNYFRITTALCRLTAVYCRSGLAHTRTRPETSSTVRLRSQSVVTYLLYFTPPTVTVNFDLFESHASLSLSLGLFLVKIGPIFPRYRVKLTMCTTHECRDGQTDGRTGGKHDVSGHIALGGCIKRPRHFSPRSAMKWPRPTRWTDYRSHRALAHREWPNAHMACPPTFVV